MKITESQEGKPSEFHLGISYRQENNFNS